MRRARERELIAEAASNSNEGELEQGTGIMRWIDDMSWRETLEAMASQPTVNIEGLVVGYTGPGSKTILPAHAVARLDFRVVPDMTFADCLSKLRAHLEKRGIGDIEVKVGGGYAV